MSSRFAEVLGQALALPEEERADLADRLLASLAEEHEPEEEEAWRREVMRRLEELRSGAVKTIPWEEVRAGFLRRATRDRFESALSKVPDREPEDEDRL